MNSIYMLARKQLQLAYFCDIYFFYSSNEISISKLLSMCNTLGVAKYIYYCVYYTNMIFNDKQLLFLLKKLEPMHDPEIINTFGLTQNELKQWGIDFYERLFGDLGFYLRNNLTQRDWYKIRQNSQYIN